jgi:hypothetical protein
MQQYFTRTLVTDVGGDRRMPHIRDRLYDNKLGDAGMAALAEGLARNTSTIELS